MPRGRPKGGSKKTASTVAEVPDADLDVQMQTEETEVEITGATDNTDVADTAKVLDFEPPSSVITRIIKNL
jgi:hypothetical protein